MTDQPDPFPLTPLPHQPGGQRNRDIALEEHLFQKIMAGELPEGIRLPSTAELATQLNVSINTVQKALARLAARGFLTRKTNHGTFVNHRQKTNENVFVLIGADLRAESNHFDRRLSRLIEEKLVERGFNPVLYDDLESIFTSPHGKRLETQLFNDLAHLDPIAFIEQNFTSLRFPQIGLEKPRTTVSFRPIIHEADVSIDKDALYRNLIIGMAENGGRRAILVLKNPDLLFASGLLKTMWATAREYNVVVEKIVHVHGERRSALEEPTEEVILRELKEREALPPGKRFDTILFCDDIQMRAASLCLLREGVAVPEEIRIVSMVNEGIDLAVGVPVIKVEIPLSAIAGQLVHLLEIRLKRLPERDPSPINLPPQLLRDYIPTLQP